MPSPGAVCPAMVRSPLLMVSLEFNVIVPDTSNTMILAPAAAIAARKLPVPESFRLVTLMTLPPRPPVASLPKPSAPGKARAVSLIGTGPPAVGSSTFGAGSGLLLQAANDKDSPKTVRQTHNPVLETR